MHNGADLPELEGNLLNLIRTKFCLWLICGHSARYRLSWTVARPLLDSLQTSHRGGTARRGGWGGRASARAMDGAAAATVAIAGWRLRNMPPRE